jgi:hypothetical protein
MQRATGPHATPCPFSACSMGVTLMLRRRLPISSASALTCLDHFDTDILREIGVLLWCIDKWVNDDLCWYYSDTHTYIYIFIFVCFFTCISNLESDDRSGMPILPEKR